MTISPENEVIVSGFDPVTKLCTYTIERLGRQWTVTIPLADLEKHKANKGARRLHLAKMLENAMAGPDDSQKAAK